MRCRQLTEKCQSCVLDFQLTSSTSINWSGSPIHPAQPRVGRCLPPSLVVSSSQNWWISLQYDLMNCSKSHQSTTGDAIVGITAHLWPVLMALGIRGGIGIQRTAAEVGRAREQWIDYGRLTVGPKGILMVWLSQSNNKLIEKGPNCQRSHTIPRSW